MRRMLGMMAAGLAFVLPQPAVAQDGAAEQAESDGEGEALPEDFDLGQLIGGMFGELYAAEPLTPEQEARLPAATQAAAVALPDGLYGRIMRQAVDGLVGPLLGTLSAPSKADLAKRVGLSADELPELDDEQTGRLADLLDPHAEERASLVLDTAMAAMEKVFAELEGPMREGLAKVYAARFEEPQLAEINTFLATPTGELYASESLAAFTDPQMMSALMRSMPLVIAQVPEAMAGIEQAMASLPEPRTFADLSADERGELAGALGLSVAELEEGMARAAAVEDEQEALESEGWDDWDEDPDEGETEGDSSAV